MQVSLIASTTAGYSAQGVTLRLKATLISFAPYFYDLFCKVQFAKINNKNQLKPLFKPCVHSDRLTVYSEFLRVKPAIPRYMMHLYENPQTIHVVLLNV